MAMDNLDFEQQEGAFLPGSMALGLSPSPSVGVYMDEVGKVSSVCAGYHIAITRTSTSPVPTVERIE